MKAGRRLLFVALIFLLAACGQGTDLNAEPDLVLGQDVCDECTMIINEARFAASYVTGAGDVRRFDDIGGMLVYTQREKEDVHKFWVHDFHSEEWIDAEKAMFVFDPELKTPMGWSVAAFAAHDKAEEYVAEYGGTMSSFAALLDSVASGAIDPESLNQHDEQDHNMDDHNMDDMEEMDTNGD